MKRVSSLFLGVPGGIRFFCEGSGTKLAIYSQGSGTKLAIYTQESDS